MAQTIPEQLIAIASEVALLETREERHHQRILDDQATIAQLRAGLSEAIELLQNVGLFDATDRASIAALRALAEGKP